MPELPLNSGSPGYVKPGGDSELLYSSVALNFCRLKLYTSPCGNDIAKNGAQFTPYVSVSRGVIFQVSCAYKPKNFWFRFSGFGLACRNCETLPRKKSDIPKPVAGPLIVYEPPDHAWATDHSIERMKIRRTRTGANPYQIQVVVGAE